MKHKEGVTSAAGGTFYNWWVRSVRKYLAAIGSVALAIAVLELVGHSVNGANAAQVLLLVLLLDARFCGAGPAIIASLFAAFGFSHYFITPTGLEFGDPNDWVSLAAFIIMAIVGGELASRAERRAAEAQVSRQESARLYQELQVAFDRASEAEAARRSEQVKAALLDALTHNLRTPLTSIKAAVTALIGARSWRGGSALPSEGQHELLEVIDEESDRLNRFIEGLSGAGTADASQPFNLRAAKLDDIIHAGLTRAETLTRDHRVILEWKNRCRCSRSTRRRSPRRSTSCSTTPANMRRPRRQSGLPPRVTTSGTCG
jgi:two-component system sensor histidine kinase KdpD